VAGVPNYFNATALTDGMAFVIDKGTFETVLGKLDGLIIRSLDRKFLVSESIDTSLAVFLWNDGSRQQFHISPCLGDKIARLASKFSKKRNWTVRPSRLWQTLLLIESLKRGAKYAKKGPRKKLLCI